MRLDDDDFTVFGLPRAFGLDRARLDERRRALQAEVHPDRFAAEGGAAQRVATQWAMRVNEAWRRLKDPLSRAAYLCELRGAPVGAESNTAMPAEFLVQQMQWREALDDAAPGDPLPALQEQARAAEEALLARLAVQLDGPGGESPAQAQAAAGSVRALMFVQRFRQDLQRRLQPQDS